MDHVNENEMSQAIPNSLEVIIEVIDELNEVVDIEEPQNLDYKDKENENEKMGSKEKENKDSQSTIGTLLIPQEGMEFNSIDEAYNFYNAYGLLRGFGTRKASSVYSKGSNILYKRSFVCEKEGKKRLDDPREAGKNIKRRPDTRENCKARMIIKLNKERKWVVVNFEDIHTHSFASPTKVKKIRSHKNMESTSKQLIMDLNDCGIGPSKISRVLNHGEGCMDSVTLRDCKNHLAKARKNNIGRQCMQVFDFFQCKIGVEDGFFFKMEVDENNQVRSIFWADKRSRMAYM